MDWVREETIRIKNKGIPSGEKKAVWEEVIRKRL
jgi:hypothetical protein